MLAFYRPRSVLTSRVLEWLMVYSNGLLCGGIFWEVCAASYRVSDEVITGSHYELASPAGNLGFK